MHQQLLNVYSQTITHVSWPFNTNQHVCYNLHQHPCKFNPLCLATTLLETLPSSDIPNKIGHIQLSAFQRPLKNITKPFKIEVPQNFATYY